MYVHTLSKLDRFAYLSILFDRIKDISQRINEELWQHNFFSLIYLRTVFNTSPKMPFCFDIGKKTNS